MSTENRIYPEIIAGSKFEYSIKENNTYLLLTERKSRTGEFWPEVVAVQTERNEVGTKTTEGQYSPISMARLASSLLYGTRVTLACFLLKKRNSGHSLEFEGLPP